MIILNMRFTIKQVVQFELKRYFSEYEHTSPHLYFNGNSLKKMMRLTIFPS